MNEDSLITTYFASVGQPSEAVRLSVGDDCALVAGVSANAASPGEQTSQSCWAISMDTLAEGVHFPKNYPPESIASRALASNLSDLAAMAAEPSWFTLSLTLPEDDERWLNAFSGALNRLASEAGIQLIGGDTCRGPLSVTIQVAGIVALNQATVRSAARTDDYIYVTGSVGDAAAGLELYQRRNVKPSMAGSPEANESEFNEAEQWLIHRFSHPQARLHPSLRAWLREQRAAVIDISDGLLLDLQRIMTASGCGAIVQTNQMPISSALRKCVNASALNYALTGGDDYELIICCQQPPEEVAKRELGVTLTCIGRMTGDGKLLLQDEVGGYIKPKQLGYQHFCATP